MEGGLGAPRRFMLMLLSGREGGGVDSRNIGLCLSASAIVQGGGRGHVANGHGKKGFKG